MNVITRGIQNLFEPAEAREQWQRLAEILHVDIDSARHIPTDERLSYRCYEIKKRSGTRRAISEPSGRLKQFQRRLCKHYLNDLPLHFSTHAFRPHHSIKTHARTHAARELVLTCDVKDFFTQTRSSRVREFFRGEGWSGEPLRAIVRLTCFRGGLPQGAPTSPVISNLVNYQLDERLAELATLQNARYSRYCDDLAFSWSVDQEPESFRVCVEGILERYGYQLQIEKGWRVQRRNERPEITGVAIHGYRLRPSKSLVQKRKRLAKEARRNPEHRRRLEGLSAFWRFLRS